MTRKTRLASALISAALLATVAVAGASAHGADRAHGRVARDLAAARDATTQFKDVSAAIAAGYGQPPAPAPLHECISSFDGTGAMGFHFINGSLLDGKVDPRKPEALVYAPDESGTLHLVALEYVVFQGDWVNKHGAMRKKMPNLFHEEFMATGDPNRYQIPAFFSLHVWLYKTNPSGLFAPFNPNVSCDPGNADARRADGPRVSQASVQFSCDMDRASNPASTRRT